MAAGGDWAWERNLQDMFNDADKDKSGFIGREDLMLMLLGAEKKDKVDPVYRAKVKFLINALQHADTDKDAKISFEEFKAHINKAAQAK